MKCIWYNYSFIYTKTHILASLQQLVKWHNRCADAINALFTPTFAFPQRTKTTLTQWNCTFFSLVSSSHSTFCLCYENRKVKKKYYNSIVDDRLSTIFSDFGLRDSIPTWHFSIRDVFAKNRKFLVGTAFGRGIMSGTRYDSKTDRVIFQRKND